MGQRRRTEGAKQSVVCRWGTFSEVSLHSWAESLMGIASVAPALLVWCLTSIETSEGRFVLASVVDITERKRAEKALRRSETHFRALAEGLPQLVWTANSYGVCDYCADRGIDDRSTGEP